MGRGETGAAAFFVAVLGLSALAVLNFPEVVIAQSASGGQEVLADPSRPVIYWAGADGNDLKFINSTTGEIIDSMLVGPAPSSICLSPDGTTLYVTIPSYKCVVLIDPVLRSMKDNVSLSFFPLSVGLDGNGYLYVSGTGVDTGQIFSIDTRTWRVKNSIHISSADLAIEISPDGATLLAIQIGTSPVKIYKYSVNAGSFSYLDADNHDLGSNFKQEAVDWVRGMIYLASGWPYGIEVVSLSTLDRLRMFPMGAYPSCVETTADGDYVFGGTDDGGVWMFNSTDGNLAGTLMAAPPLRYLVPAPDLMSIYVGLPINRIPLVPEVEHLYPAPGSQLGYSPSYLSMRLGGGLGNYNGENATPYVDEAALTFNAFDMDGYWYYYRAATNQTLAEGVHNYSISFPWIDRVFWVNSTFTVDRSSPTSLRPQLNPNSPAPGSIQSGEPSDILAFVVYTSSDWTVQGGWIILDGLNLSTTFNPQSLSAHYNNTLDAGWHNISACAYWDGGLGKAWANWSFIVIFGPHLTPIYPAVDQVLTQMPDHIEVSIDLGDTGGNVSAPQLYLDYTPLTTTISPDGTMVANVSGWIRSGEHSVKATLDWVGGKEVLTWEFTLDMFVGPDGEVLVPLEYKKEFSLLVPNGGEWDVVEDSAISGETFPLVMYGPTEGNFRTNIIVEHGSDRSVEESEDYLQEQLDAALDDLWESGISALIIESPKMVYVDNHTAYVVTIQLEGYGVYQKIAIIASEDHEMLWVIILSTTIAKYGSYGGMFDEMLGSFKIEMKPVSGWRDLNHLVIGLGIAAIVGGASGALVWLTRKRRVGSGPKQP